MAPSDGTLDILIGKLNDDEKDFLQKLINIQVAESFEKALKGDDLISSIIRKIVYQRIPNVRPLLIKNFSSENLEYFDSREKVLSFIQNVLKTGASHGNRTRLNIMGHPGSGKTSLIQSIRLNEPFLSTEENGLLETKLVDIMLVELEEQGIPRIEERKGECGRWLHLSKEVTEGVTECLLSCYDIGGRQEYYNTQRILRAESSTYLVTFESYCARPTILLVATRVDSPEDILSDEEETSILKNSMDLLKNKADTFFLFDEVFQTSASPSSNSVEQNNKIRSFGSIRKLLCSLSELSTTERGFFVPHRWEKFVEGLKTDNTILSLSKVREKFLHDRKNNVITGRESSRTKLEMDDKSKIKKLLEIAERDTRNSGSVRISRNFADVLITLREKEEEDKKEKEVADAMTREEARLLHMILEFYHNIGQILFLQEEELVVTKPEDMIKTFMDHFINSEKIEELKHSPNNKSLVLKGLYTKDWFIKEAWKHPETDMQERENYWILLQALGFGKLLTIDVVFVSLLVAQKSEKEIEQIAKKFREYRGEIRYAIICDLPEPTEPTSKPFFEDLSWELMKNTRVELCYARNLEHRRSKCLVSALMGRSAVFSDKRSKCKLCGNMRKIVLTCPTCADQYCINCSYLIEDCKSCQRKLESLQTEPQYLLSHYQICEGPKCSHKIMVEFVGENITSIRRAVNEFKEIFGEKFGVEAQSWSSACYVCIDSLKSLFKFDPANELGIEEEKGKKCNLKGHDMTGQEILEILLKKGTLMNPTEVEKSLKWMYENDKKIPNKDLHRALELAITKEYEETLDLLIRWNAVSKENIIEFLDDQITEIAFRNDEMKEEKSNQMDPEKGKLLEEEICQKKYIQGIQLDYAKLINKSNGSMTALKKIVEIIPDGGEILKHPVVEAFLMMKWYKLFWFWFFWISLKIVFLIIFVWYGSDVLMGTESTKYNCFQATENPKNRTDGNIINKTYQTEGRDSIVSVPLYYATLSLWAFLVVIEICQMFHELRQASLQSKKRNEKHISVILLVRSMKAHFDARNVLQFLILFCLTPPLLFLNSCWINHSLFSITYPVISFELLIEFGYHPALYKYVHMFLRVMKSYFKILLIYLPIIFGFCLGFYQMFPDDAKFPSGKFEMMGKTFVMLLGEIEYMDIPIQNDLFRMFFFLMFLFSMTLSLLNLLNAVAIADTNEMIKEAEKQLLYNVLILWESPFLEPIIKYGCCFPSIRLFEDETTVIFKVFKEGEAPLQTFGTYFKEILWGIKFGIRKNQRFLENQGKKTFIVSEEIKDKARIILFKKRQEHIKKLEESHLEEQRKQESEEEIEDLKQTISKLEKELQYYKNQENKEIKSSLEEIVKILIEPRHSEF